MNRSHTAQKIALTLLLLTGLSSLAFAGEFLPGTNFSLPADPDFVVALDFNGDGKIDLAVASGLADNVSILLGNGDGTFQSPVSYATQARPTGLAAGDLNGDGKVDLITANNSSMSVSVLLGNGNGTFGTANNIALPIADPYAVTLADFNGDGILDAAVSNNELANGQLLVMMGVGDGTFLTPLTYTTRGSYSDGVAAGDFNNDGHLDLAVTNYCYNKVCTNSQGSVSIFLNNGDGTFASAQDHPAGALAFGVITADFNNDGNVDLGICDEFAIGVMLGHGDGTFQRIIVFDKNSYVVEQISAGDFDGDGVTDLVGTRTNVDRISVFIGKASGGFNLRNDYAVGGDPFALAAADFNGDGHQDIVVVGGYSAGFGSMLLNSGGVGAGTLLPSSLDFGNVKIDTQSAMLPVTLTNAGTGPLNVLKIGTVGTDGPRFRQSNNCTAPVPVGGSCTINVQFEPFQTRTYNATLTVTDDAIGATQSIPIKGTGTP